MIEDRAYQARAIVSARASLAAGKRAVLLVGPTGMGKTTIAGQIAVSAVAKGSRVVFLAHRRELIDQAARRFRQFGLEVGCRGVSKLAKVQVTSPHVILSRREMPEAELVICDEAHHYVSDEWGLIPRAYLTSGARIIGLSATPERGDGIGLGALFDDLIVVSQIRELTDLGFLIPCEVMRPTTAAKMALEPWEAYQRHANGRHAVVFAPHVKAAESFAQAFRDNGITAAVVHGELDDDARDLALEQFASGEVSVLCNVMVLTEGWDCPIADTCILARDVGSPSLYLQMVGRVLRPLNGRTAPGEAALLIDLGSNVAMHGYPDEERVWSLTGQACTRRGGSESTGVRVCRVCKAEMPDDVRVCAECNTPMPEQVTPTGEGVALEKIIEREQRQEARAALPDDKRIGMLSSLYKKGIDRGHKKRAAEMAYKSMTGRYPDAKLSVAAWQLALAKVAESKGDAYEVPA